MKTNGKLTIKGQRTYKDEVYVINQSLNKLVDQNKQREKKTKYVYVPITNGYLMVEKEKYLSNRKHYDNIAKENGGRVRNKKTKRS